MASEKKQVLVVEDDYAFRWALVVELEKRGVDVDVAENGREAMVLLERNAYEIVLLDLQLPRVSGEDIVAHIAAAPQRPRVLIVTGYPEIAMSMSAERPELIARTYVKPVNVATVTEDLLRELNAA